MLAYIRYVLTLCNSGIKDGPTPVKAPHTRRRLTSRSLCLFTELMLCPLFVFLQFFRYPPKSTPLPLSATTLVLSLFPPSPLVSFPFSSVSPVLSFHSVSLFLFFCLFSFPPVSFPFLLCLLLSVSFPLLLSPPISFPFPLSLLLSIFLPFLLCLLLSPFFSLYLSCYLSLFLSFYLSSFPSMSPPVSFPFLLLYVSLRLPLPLTRAFFSLAL